MDIKTFSVLLRRQGIAIFSVRDTEIIFPGRDKAVFSLQFHQWCRKGWIRRLKRGLYEITYPEPFVMSDLYVANRLYEPSYVSLETALSHYQILPETAAQVTSVSPKPTRRFRNSHGLFTYFTVRPKAFTGYKLIQLQGQTVRIAEPGKAVVDRLYAGLRRGENVKLLADRWDRVRLRKLGKSKIMSCTVLFGASAKKLEENVHALLR